MGKIEIFNLLLSFNLVQLFKRNALLYDKVSKKEEQRPEDQLETASLSIQIFKGCICFRDKKEFSPIYDC